MTCDCPRLVHHRRNESRWEVATVKILFVDERPSALPTACAPVSAAMVSPVAAAFAHVPSVGDSAVPADRAVYGAGNGTSQTRAQRDRSQGRNASAYGIALAVQDDVKTMSVGVVRGVPPRGRPV
jgi:hypothetical protein